jgi:hypothetical protein
MSASVVRKYKLWFVWQDEEHQQWLERMAREGLHLRATNAIGMHTFVRGAPADMVYRWDVQKGTPHYLQLFRDAGWEHVASTMGWHCWRKARQAGATPEIFTDTAGKLARNGRILLPLGLALIAQVPMIVSHRNYLAALAGQDAAFQGTGLAALWLGAAAALLCLYGCIKLGLRMAALKQL